MQMRAAVSAGLVDIREKDAASYERHLERDCVPHSEAARIP
jgi:hypothetical protein